MGRTDWDLIFSINPSSITDDEIEELCPAVIQCDVDEISDVHNLRQLMRLSQEMLQYKDNQVESLLIECTELKETISSLKPAATKRKKKELEVTDTSYETSSFSKRAELSESISTEETVQSKNKKIKALMIELETLDKDNLALKERLTLLTEEMKDATGKMTEMTEELSSLHLKTNQYREKITYLEQQNIALVTQVEEVNSQQMDRDKVIDEFSVAIEARINEWKGILDEKDAEINRLKESLSQSLVQSVTSAREHTKSQIIHLNEEIERRDKIIEEFQEKLSQAVIEINESAALIEKLRADAQKSGKNDKRKEQRDLLKKLQEANQKVADVQNQLTSAQEEVESRSSKLCEVLTTLKKYESKDQSLTDALNEIKELTTELTHKNEHITDLVSVVNKLEMLNSYQEMEIMSLREKLGIPDDESILIQNTLAKRKEESKKLDELVQQNQQLAQENLELKSTMRILKYNKNKSPMNMNGSGDSVDHSREFFHSTKLTESKTEPVYSVPDMHELKAKMQIVIKENEALRTGMHEILDSIRNQDGMSEVEIQSSTLERLLEALDVRHLAGWYHPAMRMQEHLNVIQGSNAELRSQIRHLRRELQKKDAILQNVALHKNTAADSLYSEDGENEELAMYISELKNLREAYENEADEWEKQKESLLAKNTEHNNELDRLKLQIELYEKNLKTFEENDDEIQKAFAIKTREHIEAASEILVINKKNVLLQDLLNSEIAKGYQYQKDAVRNESAMRKALADLSKRNNAFENEISALQSNLANTVSIVRYNELKEKYEETSMRLRNLLEHSTAHRLDDELQRFKEGMEELRRNNAEAVEILSKQIGRTDENDMERELREIKVKEHEEKQRADHMAKLYEFSEAQLLKSEARMKEIEAAKVAFQDELIALHKQLSSEARSEIPSQFDDNKLKELQDTNAKLQVEIENLKQLLKASSAEAERQYSTNSLKALELDSLRHQILDLQAASEDKATISRLDFELTRKKMSEIELNEQKIRLENEVSDLQEKLENLRSSAEGFRTKMEDCRKQCENRCRNYMDTISFLQSQYAGSTPLCTLSKISCLSEKLRIDRLEIQAEMKKARECNENAKLQQDLLNNRLQIVESLKEILEQQIGTNNVHDIMQRFSEYSQYTLADFKYKRRITQLEYELQIASNKFTEYESIISSMEQDMFELQKAWSKGRDQQSKIETQSSGTSPLRIPKTPAFSQTSLETKSTEIQTDPYKCCSEKPAVSDVGIQVKLEPSITITKVVKKPEEKPVEPLNKQEETQDVSSVLQEKLNQALKLASERSGALIKCETQLSECKTKLELLTQSVEAKDSQLSRAEKALEELKGQSLTVSVESSDVLALKSTINSQQKLLGQKEETIARYQNMLKEERNENGEITTRLHGEIKELHERIVSLQNELQKSQSEIGDCQKNNSVRKTVNGAQESTRAVDTMNGVMREDEIARLSEQVSHLEADLEITKELSERWHRLAEERLKHMDRVRERLEEQHKSELESYRGEIDKWQMEADALRKQLSENRMLLTKGNISLMRELQDRDDKIHELTLTCQQLQNEVEMLGSTNRTHPIIIHTERESKCQESAHTTVREHMVQTDNVRKQLQSLLEKEKMYKQELADLKQQLSRRYMATKSQEKRISQRETQLQNKVKSLEDELKKARCQLDHEFLIQEAKKAKTAEELSLWEKQKKWQQTAEKLREKLKEKTDEHTKLLANYEKLRTVVACMEREKWYLRSKLKVDNNNFAGSFSARPTPNTQQSTVAELQKECHVLRERVTELTDRLCNEDNAKLLLKIEEQRRRILALETVSEGNSCVVGRLEKLEMTKDILERMNLKLESENFELRLKLENANAETPRLREKIEHLEKYIGLLKVEKSSDSSPRSSERDVYEHGVKKSTLEMEKTIFTLKRIVERLQAENKRLRTNAKKCCELNHRDNSAYDDKNSIIRSKYEEAQRRIVTLETDLQLAEQRAAMLERIEKNEDAGEVEMLKDQLHRKSELLDKMKDLLAKAAVNEKSLRQRLQQVEAKHTLSPIPECYVTPPTPK